MTDIPEHIVQAVRHAIPEAAMTATHEEAAAIILKALGGETVLGNINRYSYGHVYPDRAEDTPIKSFTERYILIPLGEEGEQ